MECGRNGRSRSQYGRSSAELQHSDSSRKTVFVLDTIIELLLKRSGDIIKFVAGPLADVYLKALLVFRCFLKMITQKHGRKLASQLGEVLFICQFYDLQIVKKISLSLRNLWLHLVCVCVCVSFLSTKALHVPNP